MTQSGDLERLVTSWLQADAPAREPEGLFARSLVHVRRTRQQPRWLTVVRGTSMDRGAVPGRLVPSLVLLGVVVGALLVGIAIGSGGRLPPAPAPSTPSASAAPLASAAASASPSIASPPPGTGLPGRFAFSSRRDGDLDIYTMRPDGSELRQLTNINGIDGNPTWSPDGTRLAFMSRRGGDDGIYVMNADGTGVTVVANGPGEDLFGAWSPDGTRIAYTNSQGKVLIIGLDGTVQREIPVKPGPGGNFGLTVFDWMPDGKDLVMVWDSSPDGGDLDIFRVRIADGHDTRLTNTALDDGSPVVSPDGSKIAFQRDRNGGCLYVMDADGANGMRLTTGCSKGFPIDWAPDGSWIGWGGANRDDHDQPWDISVIRPDGTERTALTDTHDVLDFSWGPLP